MMTSSRQPRSNTDRWLVSYADFITLLFAFFVTMYAVSSVDATKLVPAASSIQTAFNSETMPPAVQGTPSLVVPPVVVPPVPTANDIRLNLTAALGDAIDAGTLEITEDARGVVLSLPEAVTFATGSVDVAPGARPLIQRVGLSLVSLPNALRIEGHTDDVPIAGRYRSNWELSSARAAAVVQLLVERAGIAAPRLSAAGYGEFHPRVPNDSARHRAQNRRVDIVVLLAAPAPFAAAGPRS
jgi:chemotaxis protein MotB